MPTILDEIVEAKRKEVALQKESVSLADLEGHITSRATPENFSRALRGRGVQLISPRGASSLPPDPLMSAGG